MKMRSEVFNWRYIFQVEDSTAQLVKFDGGLLKITFWAGMSILLSLGIAQLH